MISFYNPYGKICISERYFTQLINSAVKNAVGVAGMAQQDAKETLKSFLSPQLSPSGVQVTEENSKLRIDLHIKVVYGVNIPQTVNLIKENVRYSIETMTGFFVECINVSVDGVVS